MIPTSQALVLNKREIMRVRMKSKVAIPEGKCLLKLRFLTSWLIGVTGFVLEPEGNPEEVYYTSHLGAFVFGLRVGDIWVNL